MTLSRYPFSMPTLSLSEDVLQALGAFAQVVEDDFKALTAALGPVNQWISWRSVSAALFVAFGLRVLSIRRRLGAIGNVPGLRLVVAPEFPYPLPRIPYICMDAEWWNKLRHEPFADAGTDVLSVASLTSGTVSYVAADPVALKISHQLIKPQEMYKLLNLVGVHIVTAEGADYRRHRMPAQGSFTERNNRLVWDTSLELAQRITQSDTWIGKDVVEIDEAVKLTLPYAMRVINVAGFGRSVSDSKVQTLPAGSVMTFEEAIEVAMANLVTLAIVPRWAIRWVASWRRVDDSLNEALNTSRALIAERRADLSDADDRIDLLSSLVRAADSEADPNLRLTDAELVSDVIAFLVAGHETTAHSVAIALGLLALHPEEQDKVYEELKTYSEPGMAPKYEDLNKLRRIHAVLQETLRLYPPIPRISKASAVDTHIPLAFPAPNGMTSVPVPKGTIFTAHIVGLHYNPRWWKDPFLFRPERFLDPEWPRDAFLPFSAGPRVCIGRRFAETESIAFMATILAKYHVELPHHTKQKLEGITDERVRRERGLKVEQRLTLMPVELGLVFRKRKGDE
ncbi:cytochrome P450 [Auriculariales sp. MPI-PUGE-AT-0066]|nr:cytochrome P450 [Auriculariales sp. MPI-PUGE-AT-0066]